MTSGPYAACREYVNFHNLLRRPAWSAAGRSGLHYEEALVADKPTVEEAPPEAPPDVLLPPSAKAASRPPSSKEAPTEVTGTCGG